MTSKDILLSDLSVSRYVTVAHSGYFACRNHIPCAYANSFEGSNEFDVRILGLFIPLVVILFNDFACSDILAICSH